MCCLGAPLAWRSLSLRRPRVFNDRFDRAAAQLHRFLGAEGPLGG